MKTFVPWAVMAFLGIILALSACQQEESKEILEQSPSAFSGEEGSAPEAPEGVSFVEIEIPDEYQSEVDAGVSEIIPFEAFTTEDEIVTGELRITLPETGENNTLIKVEISSSFMEAIDTSPTFWVDLEDPDFEARFFDDCSKEKKGGGNRFWCHAGNVFKALTVGVAVVEFVCAELGETEQCFEN